MKNILNRSVVKMMKSTLASVAMILSMPGVSNTCGFMLFQFDVPVELL